MKDLVKSLESVKRSLAKSELPCRWNQESFTYAQNLAKILIKRLENLVGSKIEVKPIEPKICKILPKLTETIYVLGLETSLSKIPKDAQTWKDIQAGGEDSLKKIKSLSKSIARKLQIFLDKGNEESESRTLT